ncbi:N-acetyltransferase ESCO2 [Odontomachus brunneus]|uniref:N-acetyltransferase ESCO2 n=1 Tax=Odontomachus brunneus TaxID=486640 RepID=UPI0013F23E05|nr:N-acetyltransferase ESCO2 [Odontomachus brunneus]
MAMHNDQTNLLCTPRRAQKCLFAPSGSSCKKNLSQDSSYNRDIEVISEEDSDLGPMSPLALTDRSPSSCESSPGRDFVSPLATPEKSPSLPVTSLSWDRLIPNGRNTEDYTSFSSLKKLSRAARYSPRCNAATNNYPKSMSPSPVKQIMESLTPKCSEMSAMTDEIIPDTPQRSFATEIQNQSITETPRKGGTPGQHRLITPLGSITKSALLPKLHRRKSLGTLEANENISPEQKENTLKRHARDQLLITPAKLFKADDTSAPRARAALFQEKKTEASAINMSLSTKTFYSNNRKSERAFVVNSFRDNDMKRRRSLPAQSSSSRRSLKKQRFGMINVGVWHGIKKPKSKLNPKALKKKAQQLAQDAEVSSENQENKSPSAEQFQPVMEANTTAKRAFSPEIDENKRFFKTIRSSQAATVTVNKKIKLKVADGKIQLNKKHGFSTNGRNKQGAKALTDVPYDATDLTVDEPGVEATLEKNKVANILKILEDDWADDDYDKMETLITNTVSPLKSTTLPQDAIMSPASELSNMASTMNIKDVTSLTNFGNLSLNNTENNNNPAETNKEPEKRYFPLFTKGYTAQVDLPKQTEGISKSTKKSTQWQLSVKGGQDQYQLDAGQKHFGATQCPECNVVYQLGDAEDENAHLNYHNSIRTLRFQGWKNERVMSEDPFTSSRVILVEPNDPKQYWKKVSDILAVVDRDLGLADMKLSDYENKKVFLYIREKNVLGVLVAEHIKTAHRMIPELIELDCCTAESTPTKCGINVVWTAMSHRRQGIATKLVNTLRAKFFYGYVMSLDDIAFSTPSPSGKIFAEKYTKTRNFKVYS